MNTTLFYLRYTITGLMAALELYHGHPVAALISFVAANWVWTKMEEHQNTRWNQRQTHLWRQRTTPDHEQE